jgi:hypothetical protein
MNWLHSFWFNYEWPSIKGNGPEDFTALAVVTVFTAVLYPPVRQAIDRYVKAHVDAIKAHVTAEHAHLHAKLDHVILHTKGIPNEIPGLPPDKQPRT